MALMKDISQNCMVPQEYSTSAFVPEMSFCKPVKSEFILALKYERGPKVQGHKHFIPSNGVVECLVPVEL